MPVLDDGLARARGDALTEGGVQAVHAAALDVLSRTGVLVGDTDAVALLRAHGARVDGQRVYLGEGAVRQALSTAPAGFTLAARDPARDLAFGSGHVVYGSTSGPTHVLVGETMRPGALDDLRTAVKLGHLSTGIGFHGRCITACDVPPEEQNRRSLHVRIVLSDKPGEFPGSTDEDLEDGERVNEILHGADWHRVPRALVIHNTDSPLQIAGATARAIARWASLGQPVCVTSCVMGGTTGPATLGGILTLQHAEVLAALVLSQAAGPGSPFVYGGASTLSSMRTGAFYAGIPALWAISQATVQLGHFCGLPVRTGGALTDAHILDAQAALESALCLSVAVQAGADFIFHAAGVLSSFNALSFEKFVMDDELITLVSTLEQGVATSAEDLAVEVIDAVGPAGHFLAHAHTRRHARDHQRESFFVRETFERWCAPGGPDIRAAAARHVARLLEAYRPPDDLDGAVRRQLDDYCLR